MFINDVGHDGDDGGSSVVVVVMMQNAIKVACLKQNTPKGTRFIKIT
jgi:hypothetical protein